MGCVCACACVCMCMCVCVSVCMCVHMCVCVITIRSDLGRHTFYAYLITFILFLSITIQFHFLSHVIFLFSVRAYRHFLRTNSHKRYEMINIHVYFYLYFNHGSLNKFVYFSSYIQPHIIVITNDRQILEHVEFIWIRN